MQANNQDIAIAPQKIKSKSGLYFHDENLKTLVNNLLVAGIEPVHSTLRWGLLLMMKYPDIQRKRSCIGENLAKTELFLLFTRLLQTFTILPCPGVDLDFHPEIGFVHSSKPYMMRTISVFSPISIFFFGLLVQKSGAKFEVEDHFKSLPKAAFNRSQWILLLYEMVYVEHRRKMASSLCFENSASSSVSHLFSVPTLTDNDTYHVFMSFSAADSAWVHRLIHKLEATFPNIKICAHDRDFTAGKTIIENMTECIQNSQKILIVLSPHFVRSRWCLFEANLSMFQECMSHKVIVPVMLKPCPMPLYLSHLTYLDNEDEDFFEKLCNRLLKSNAKETKEVLVRFQSSILYGGKHLLSLNALNRYDEEANNGTFSNTCVPGSLKAVVKDPELYKKAIQLINDTPTFVDVLNSKWSKTLLITYLLLLFGFSVICFISTMVTLTCLHFLHLPATLVLLGYTLYKMEYWKRQRLERLTQNMSRRTGEANLLLAETSILAGCSSKSSLVFVFASLKECRDIFQITFGDDKELVESMWRKAVIKYSSDYANCMAKKKFPCSDPQPPGHLPNGICFCQYVAMQIQLGDWP
ncbi:uncharacterized protein RB166_005806 [Leptodactylus fuscus]